MSAETAHHPLAHAAHDINLGIHRYWKASLLAISALGLTASAGLAANRYINLDSQAKDTTAASDPFKPIGPDLSVAIANPDTMVEKTSNLVEDSNQKIDTILKLRSGWKDNDEVIFPTPALSETFALVKNSRAKLQKIFRADGNYSPDEIKTINNIYFTLNNAPGKDKQVEETTIYVDPEAKNGQFIAEQVKELLAFFPHHERIVRMINILSRDTTWRNRFGSWIADQATVFSKDQGAEIVIPDRPNDQESWDKKYLLQLLAHEMAHTASLYSNNPLQFLSPVEVIDLVLENTSVEDEMYKVGYGSVNMEENNAYLTQDILGSTNTLSMIRLRDPKIKQDQDAFVNRWFSKLLGADINIDKIGEQLNIRDKN